MRLVFSAFAAIFVQSHFFLVFNFVLGGDIVSRSANCADHAELDCVVFCRHGKIIPELTFDGNRRQKTHS